MEKHRIIILPVGVIAFLLLITALMPLCPASALEKQFQGMVTKVSDGDTAHVTTQEGTKLRIRLYGMDAPETEKRDYRSGKLKSPGQPYGPEAEKALASLVFNRQVVVEVVDIDQYRRLVGIIWLGNRNINVEMVRGGYAEAYREFLRNYRTEILAAEAAAKKERRGIWGLNQYERPKDFRKRMRLSGES